MEDLGQGVPEETLEKEDWARGTRRDRGREKRKTPDRKRLRKTAKCINNSGVFFFVVRQFCKCTRHITKQNLGLTIVFCQTKDKSLILHDLENKCKHFSATMQMDNHWSFCIGSDNSGTLYPVSYMCEIITQREYNEFRFWFPITFQIIKHVYHFCWTVRISFWFCRSLNAGADPGFSSGGGTQNWKPGLNLGGGGPDIQIAPKIGPLLS